MPLKLQIKKIIEQTKLKQTEKELREIINNNFLLKMIPYKFAKIINIQEIYKACIDDINKFNNNLDQVQKNQFIQTCDEDQLSLYEGILNIENGKKLKTDLRRIQILSIFSNILPFTLVSLIEKVNNILGYNNWELFLDYNKYTLRIKINISNKREDIESLIITLLPMVPAHIQWHFYKNIHIEETGNVYITGYLHKIKNMIINEYQIDNKPDLNKLLTAYQSGVINNYRHIIIKEGE